MTTEQQREILEAAAKACGAYRILAYTDDGIVVQWSSILRGGRLWNPIDNSADTAAMCAKLEIDTIWYHGYVECVNAQGILGSEFISSHDNSRLKAWMFAATMAAAKIGDLK